MLVYLRDVQAPRSDACIRAVLGMAPRAILAALAAEGAVRRLPWAHSAAGALWQHAAAPHDYTDAEAQQLVAQALADSPEPSRPLRIDDTRFHAAWRRAGANPYPNARVPLTMPRLTGAAPISDAVSAVGCAAGMCAE